MSFKYKLVEQVCLDRRFEIDRVIDETTLEPKLIKTINSEFTSVQANDWLAKDYAFLENFRAKTIIQPEKIELHQSSPFLVLSNCAGQSLAQFLEQQSVSFLEFLDIGIQLTEALAEIHQQGIVHQNIQPGCIVIDPASLELKIIDFSLATRLTAVVKAESKQSSGFDAAYIAPRTNWTDEYSFRLSG